MKQLFIVITLFISLSANETNVQDALALYEQEAYSEAFILFEKACDESSGAECLYIAGMYEKGRGVKMDIGKARINYTKACDDNDIFSCNALALFYHDGIGVKKDLHKSKQIYKKSCDSGSALACDYYNELTTRK